MSIADPNEVRHPLHAQAQGLRWLLAEAWDHLWPWGRTQTTSLLLLVSMALALAATLVWLLAALGYLSATAIIAWWFGWSVIEVAARLEAKPYVKEGAWWGRLYRRASWMDMICYVSFKNLLIGATFFLLLKSLGSLQA